MLKAEFEINVYINGGSRGKDSVERKLGSGQGTILTRIPNSNHTWSSGIGSDVAMVIWYWF